MKLSAEQTADEPKTFTERERCVEIVRAYLSPRLGIRLARHPHGILEEIIDKIRSGVQE